jgi:hypothetical protein
MRKKMGAGGMKRGGLQQKRFVPRPAGDCWSPAGLGRPTAS